MNNLFLIIFISFSFLPSLFAQSKSRKLVDDAKHDLQIAIPDTSNNDFFIKFPTLKFISVSYKNNQPYIVFLNFEDGSKREHYDLAFEGDAYVLEKKYGSIHLMDTKANIRSTWSNKDTSITFSIVGTSIFKDTIFYSGRQVVLGKVIKDYNPDWIVGMPAKYKGDLRLMENRLAKEFAKMEHGVEVDSIVVFHGTVSKRGSLSDMTLIAGKQSVFSKLIHKAFVMPKDEFDLLPPREDWFSAGIDRGPIETRIKIYARLNNDGSITIKTPRRLRTFTGE